MVTESVRALTGLRGLAILIVLVSHLWGRDLGVFYEYVNFQGMGRFGIYIFFVLSAFLCHQSLQRHSLSGYFIKRFFRIVPAFYFILVALLIYSIFCDLDPLYLHIDEHPMYHFLFLRGDGIFWTIPTEIFYYLLIPLVSRFFNIKMIAVAAIGYFLWYFAFLLLKTVPSPTVIYNEHDSQYIDVFLVGSLAFYLRDNAIWPKIFSYRTVPALLISLIIIGLCVMCKNILGLNFGLLSYAREASLFWAVLVGLLLLGIYHNSKSLVALLDNGFLKFLGKHAYTIYLLHMGVFQLVNTFSLGSGYKLTVAVVLTLLLGFILSRFIERPGIVLGDRIIGSFQRREG